MSVFTARAWLGRLAAGAAALACLASVPAMAADAGPLAAAASRLEAALAVAQAADAAADDAAALAHAADALAGAFAQAHGARTAEARRAVAEAQACIGPLQAGVDAARGALQQALSTLDAAHLAVRTTAAGPASALAAAKAGADRAFAARNAAEQALAERRRELAARRSDCERALWLAGSAHDKLRQAVGGIQQQAAEIAPMVQGLRGLLEAAEQARREAAATLGAGLPPVQPPALPAGETAAKLARAMAEGPAAVPGRAAEAPSPAASADLVGSLATYARLRDAAAYASLAGSAGGCIAAGCRGQATTLRALALRQADARVTLDEALAAAEAVPPGFGAAVAGAQRTFESTAAVLADAAPVLPAVLAEARAGAAAASAAIRPLQQAAAEAVVEAERAWRLAGGQMVQQQAQVAAVAPPLVFEPPAAGMGRPPRGHAWSVFRTLGTRPGMGREAEPEGFRAYTYVVVEGDALADREVYARFATVVQTVMARTSRADAVAAEDREQVNVFCFPSATGASASAADVIDGYADDLGKALRLRAQTGLLARPELRALFARSAGPFLLTLPRRAAESKSDTPLLLADLAPYPPAAIRDLVESYMGGLLKEFPDRQAEWRPPTAMQVALTLVSWATGPARVISGLVPEAQATARRRR